MGVTSALFVILLSISGLILHQSVRLDLDRQFIESSTMLAWYDIEVPGITLSYSAADDRVSLIADAIYFNARRVAGSYSALVGLVHTDFAYALATNDQILLLTRDGDLVEVLGSVHGVPFGIEAIGSAEDGAVYLKIAGSLIEADLDALTWAGSVMQESAIEWSSSSAPSEQMAGRIGSDYAASLLSWERLVLDIHSGRFLGKFGVVLVDIMALLFVFMAVTGIWIWSRRRPSS